ncbi:MAG: aromatic amino acid ammonia-lyase [Chitinophagales bacterium]
MIAIGKKALSLQDVAAIVYDNAPVSVQDVLPEANENFKFLKEFSGSDKVIYGINTGFGPMAQYKIPYSERLSLQYNLIRSHASGNGQPIAIGYCKAMLLDRLSTFAQCRSGVHPDLLVLLAEMLNRNLIPVIYEHGGVGASGDLVQLAHLALAVVGEGEVFYKGKITPAKLAFEQEGITPFAIRLREGLAMMNGTSCMTGIGLLNLIAARKLLHLSTLLSVTINELFEAYDDHISEELNVVKRHAGQREIARQMREMVKGSKLMRSRHEHLYKETNETHFKDKVQEYYSLRCMPQILGPVFDTIAHAERVVLDELQSVSDNPVVDHHKKNIYHGGNFHGDYIGLEMDKLKIAITKLSMLADRQLNYLLNDKLNGKLPPFINTLTIGLNFGIQGIQYSATSTVAENKALSHPVYIQSIPSNNDNQDIVSMGSNAALMCARVINNTFEVLAVHALSIAEATDYLELQEQLSPAPKQLYQLVRSCSKKITADEPKFEDLRAITTALKTWEI